MSWQDRLENIPFKIVTYGRSGATPWYPLLLPNYQKMIEYNGTQYEFINRSGSLFARRFPKGRVYQLEFAFQGEDNDKLANSFELETRIANPMEITHPLYGTFKAQPMSMEISNSGLNTAVIKCTVVETIEIKNNKYVQQSDSTETITQKIYTLKSNVLLRLSVNNTPVAVTVKDIQMSLKEIDKISAQVSLVSKLESEYKAYKKNLNNVVNAINTMTSFSENVMLQIQSFIELPAIVSSDIGSRIVAVNNVLNSLIQTIQGAVTPNYYQKMWYNLCGATCISALCRALSIQNTGDFQTKSDVLFYVENLQNSYEKFLQCLYGIEDSAFTPDHDVMFSTHEMVCETAFYLYSLIFKAKQERIHYTPRDTNIILLAHRLYGLASDENILQIKNTNKIGLSEIINIKKDRPIKYYV